MFGKYALVYIHIYFVFTVDKDYLQTSQPHVQIEDADSTTLKMMVDQLTQRLAEKEAMKNTLLAVDVRDTRAVWVRESTEWVKQCHVPDEYPLEGVCVSHVSDGLVIAGGMIEHGTPNSQCHHFSLSTRQWRKLENMRTSRYYASAVEVEEMLLLVVGGRGSDGAEIDVCERLDIRRGVWTPAASLPTWMFSPLVAGAGGRVFFLEHSKFSGAPNFPFGLNIFYWSIQNFPLVEYDPASDSHTQKTSLPHHVWNTWNASLVGVAHKLYLFGGEEKLALQYELATEQWHKLVPSTDMITTGYYPVVRSTEILLCGGSSEGGHGRNRILSYNVNTKQWKILDICLPFRYVHDVSHYRLYT